MIFKNSRIMFEHSEGAKKFLSFTVEDLEKMFSNSRSKRNEKISEWVSIASNLYLKPPFFNSNSLNAEIAKRKSFAFTGALAKTVNDFIANKIASSFPIVAKFQNDSNNILTPALSIVEQDYKKKITFNRASKEKIDEYLKMYASSIAKMITSNSYIQEVVHKILLQIFLFGNAGYKLDIFCDTNQFKLFNIDLDAILIEEDYFGVRYFYQDLFFSWSEVCNYFTSEAQDVIKKEFSDILKPENMFNQKIHISQYAYYCDQNKKTYVKYALAYNHNNKFLEDKERILDYNVFTYIRTDTNNELYGNSTRQDILSRVEAIQTRYFELQKKLEKFNNPDVVQIKDLSFQDTLESSREHGAEQYEQQRRFNANKQYRKIDTELLMQLLNSGVGRNINLNYPELPNEIQMQFNFLQQEIHEFNSSFITFAEERNNITDLQNEKLTLGEFSTRQALSNSKTKRDFQIIEMVLGSIIQNIMEASIFKLNQQIKALYETSGVKDEFEFENIYLGQNHEEMQKRLLLQIIELDSPLTEEQIKNNPFAYLLDEEIENFNNQTLQEILSQYQELQDLYIQATSDNDIEQISKITNAIKTFENEYENVIKEKFLPVLEKSLTDLDLERVMLDNFNLPSNILYRAPKEFLYFILSYAETKKELKFEIASSEANLINNSEIAEFPKFAGETLQLIQTIPDPDTQIKLLAMLNIDKNWLSYGKALNIDMMEGKELQKEVEKKQQQAMQQQAMQQQQ